MWRRAIASQLRTVSRLRSAPSSLRPSIPKFTRHFATGSGNAVGVRPEDVNPIATGHRREEIEAEIKGKNILEDNYPIGPFGTKEAPAVVRSIYNARIVGCPGGADEDEHDVVWFWLEKDKPYECPVCSQYFVLEVNGPGGLPPHGAHDSDQDEPHH